VSLVDERVHPLHESFTPSVQDQPAFQIQDGDPRTSRCVICIKGVRPILTSAATPVFSLHRPANHPYDNWRQSGDAFPIDPVR